MAKIKVKTNLPAAEPPCPPPVPNAAPKTMMVPTDPPRMPLPPPPFLPGACCRPGTTQVVDNVTVISLTPDTLEVTEGTVGGMKAFALSSSLSNEHITVEGGENVEVDREQVDNEVTYTVNAIIPETDHVTVKAGENVNVKTTKVGHEVSYTVSAEVPETEHVDIVDGEHTTVVKTVDDNNVTFQINADIPEAKEVEVVEGQNVTVETVDTPTKVTYTVNAVIPEATEYVVAGGTNVSVTKTETQGTTTYTVNADVPEQVQSDWDEDDPTSPAYVNNKPVVDQSIDINSTNAVSNHAVAEELRKFGGFKKVNGDANNQPDVPLDERSTKIVYLVSVPQSSDPDHCREWIWNVPSSGEPYWECIGDTSVAIDINLDIESDNAIANSTVTSEVNRLDTRIDEVSLIVTDATGVVSGTTMTVTVDDSTYTKFTVPATITDLVIKIETPKLTGHVSQSMFEFTLPSETALENVSVIDAQNNDRLMVSPMSWPGTVTYQGTVTNGIATIFGYAPDVHNGPWLHTSSGQFIGTSTGKKLKYVL